MEPVLEQHRLGGDRFYDAALVTNLADPWNATVVRAAVPVRDPAGNVAYTLHSCAHTHGAPLRARAEAAMRRGAAIFVTGGPDRLGRLVMPFVHRGYAFDLEVEKAGAGGRSSSAARPSPWVCLREGGPRGPAPPVPSVRVSLRAANGRRVCLPPGGEHLMTTTNVAGDPRERTASGRPSIPPGPALMQILLGGAVVPMIGAAVELGFVAALAARTRSAAEVARDCGTPLDTTHRLMRGLSTVGIVDEHADGRFSLSPMGEFLLPEVPGSFDALARLNGSEWCGGVYLGLAEAVRSGQSAFRTRHGEGIFDWLSKRGAEREVFARAMSTFSGLEAELVLGAYDFSPFEHIVDVGGGQGLLLSRLLQRAPGARGTLFDLPEVAEGSARLIAPEVRQRCRALGGSFFDELPRGGDLYVLKHILHDWDDARAAAILRNVARAIRPGGTVIVAEQGIAPPGVPNPGKLMDLIMLALVDGGRERSADEHAALMRAAGITFERHVSTPGAISLFVGRRP